MIAESKGDMSKLYLYEGVDDAVIEELRQLEEI